jgi:Ca2+-binding EF-hand superfamily protein
MRKKMERKKRRDNNEDDGENEDENDNQDNQGNQFQNLNKVQTFGRNDQNFDNNNPDNNMMSKTSPIIGNNPDNNIMPKTSPGINNNQDNNMMSKAYPNIGNNQDNQDNNMLSKSTPNININDNEKRGSKDLFGSTTKTLYTINNNNKINLQGSRIPSKVEEESEEEITSKNLDLHKSYEEVMDDREKKFIKYLKEVIKSEREIEFARRDLMRQRDFNGEDAFRLFEVEGSGVVTKKDLNFGLKLLGINPTFYQIVLIFNRYDLDGNDFMEYQDFFDMVVSYKDEDRKEEEKRKSNRNIGNRRKELFSPRTRDLYKKLFLVIIEEEERLEKLRQKLNINDQMMNEIFYKINEDKDGICNKNEFANYCLRNNICKERKDAYLVFIRLNKNRDGGLESKEFSNELKSSVLGP